MIRQNSLDLKQTLEPARPVDLRGRLARIFSRIMEFWLDCSEKNNTWNMYLEGPYTGRWWRFPNYYSWREYYSTRMQMVGSDRSERHQ